MKKINYPYQEFNDLNSIPLEFELIDHAGGFDINLDNRLFRQLNDYGISKGRHYRIYCEYILSARIREQYSNLTIHLQSQLTDELNYRFFLDYRMHPELDYKNFLCSFNGTIHVSRKLLTAALHRFGWFDPAYSSKNFVYSEDELTGHIQDYVGSKEKFYNKFFVGTNSSQFFNTKYSFGHLAYQHEKNIYNLEKQLTQSFVHVVSETLATSYYPFVTEKFLYSVVTRGLFLAYAQPGWHNYIEQYLGYKKYQKIFDYKFDLILDPVERLIEMLSMLSKFSVLSADDWRDLYLLEQDTIEYNYNHYYSGNYLNIFNEHLA